jgi:hypothetical protein
MTRDQLKNEAYFSKAIELDTKSYQEFKDMINTVKDSKKGLCCHTIFSHSHRILIERFSRGDQIQDLKDDVLRDCEVLKLRRKILDDTPMKESTLKMWEDLDLTSLYDYLSLFAFMKALHFGKERFKEVLDQLKTVEQDGLLVLVQQHATGQKLENVPPSKYPAIYNELIAIVEAEAEKRPELMKKYLEHWYQSMKPIHWFDNDKAAEGAYIGYWAFDAALVVMLFDIDDSTFRNNKFYPKDLVDNNNIEFEMSHLR